MTKEQTALDIARRMAELESGATLCGLCLALADAWGRQPETELRPPFPV